MRRSVTTTSKVVSASALVAAPTSAASITRWPRFLSRRAMVARAEGSSSTRRIAATCSRSRERQEDREARPPAGSRFHLDPPAVGGDDATSERQAESGARRLAGVEGIEDAATLLGEHAAAGVADADRH